MLSLPQYSQLYPHLIGLPAMEVFYRHDENKVTTHTSPYMIGDCGFLEIITYGLQFPLLAKLHSPRLGFLLFQESLEDPRDGYRDLKKEQGSTSGANE